VLSMSLSYAQSQTAITTQSIFEQLLNDVKTVNVKTSSARFSALEIELHQLFAAAERACMKKLLENYDWDYPVFQSNDKEIERENQKKYIDIIKELDCSLERWDDTYLSVNIREGADF